MSINKVLSSFIITTITAIVLALFLSPFLYMVFTSLKSSAQMAVIGSPIWPAAYPTFTMPEDIAGTYTLKVNKTGKPVDMTLNMTKYAGKELDIYIIPFPDGTTKEMVVLQGYQKGSVLLDPSDPTAPPIAWEGYFKSQPRSWTFSPTWGNFAEMWKDIHFMDVLGNTLYYAFVTTIGTLLSCILVAYGFSRFRFPGRDFLFILLISILFLPAAVTIIPTFTFWTKISTPGPFNLGVGSWWPLIIPSFFANPYDVFLLRQYFMTLPKELDEAAMIDGAGPLRILWSVIIPQSYPVIVAVAVFHVVWAWNDYFGPLIYLSTKRELLPVSVALAYFNGIYGSRPELIQAGALLTLIIPVILFFAAQRFFVQGIVITGVEK